MAIVRWYGPGGVLRPTPVSLPLVTEPTDPPEPTPERRHRSADARSAGPSTGAPGPHRPSGAVNPPAIQYKGEPLEAERGPGLGCFRFQLVLLAILIIVTPLSVGRVPEAVSAVLLGITILLLLVSGQTIIFLLRLVAADRRGRRQPLASRSPTVGQLEDAAPQAPGPDGTAGPGEDGGADATPAEAGETAGGSGGPDSPGSGPVRQ